MVYSMHCLVQDSSLDPAKRGDRLTCRSESSTAVLHSYRAVLHGTVYVQSAYYSIDRTVDTPVYIAQWTDECIAYNAQEWTRQFALLPCVTVPWLAGTGSTDAQLCLVTFLPP